MLLQTRLADICAEFTAMYVCMDGWMDGWLAGWMDGSMDGWMYALTSAAVCHTSDSSISLGDTWNCAN